jgi:hypothetical protein
MLLIEIPALNQIERKRALESRTARQVSNDDDSERQQPGRGGGGSAMQRQEGEGN